MVQSSRSSVEEVTTEGVRHYCRRLELVGVSAERAAEIQAEMLASLNNAKQRRGMFRLV